ncbi:hypothetical protein BSLG_007077 [Batrachochytrium salamandrivorans]|nr:hypothetical protein BSLG_007077 [Batrachochytrium salamandrivorans]
MEPTSFSTAPGQLHAPILTHTAAPAKHTYPIESVLSLDASLMFDFESYITQTLKIQLTRPIAQAVCSYFLRGACRQGSACPFKHPQKVRAVVCKHWLRGLCKKGEVCEFLHEYNMKRMPECWFFAKLGECTNPECQYLHIDPDSKVRECPWYTRGFCKHGAECRHKHTRKAACQNYLTGFCPNGESCQFGHAKHELPVLVAEEAPIPGTAGAPRLATFKTVAPRFGSSGGSGGGGGSNNNNNNSADNSSGDGSRGFRSLTQVTCFKCNEVGHYANSCPTRRRADE